MDFENLLKFEKLWAFAFKASINQHKDNNIKKKIPVTGCSLLQRPPFSCFLSNYLSPWFYSDFLEQAYQFRLSSLGAELELQ